MSSARTYQIAFQIGARMNSSLRTAFANANRNLNQANNNVNRLNRTNDGLNRSMRSLSGEVNRTSTRFANFARSTSANITNGIITPFRSAIGMVKQYAGALGLLSSTALAGTGMARLSAIENAEVSLKVLLGDAKTAKGFLDEVLAFAKTTPFAFPDLAETSRNLVAFGMNTKKVVPTMRAIGDAAAASGKGAEGFRQISSAFGAMQVSGTLSLGEVNRLADAGIPALKILANSAGVSVESMKKKISSGSMDAVKAIDVLVKGMQNGTNGIAGKTAAMGGLMEEMKDTWVGSVDSLKSSISSTMATIMEPAKPHIQNAMAWFGNQFKLLPNIIFGAVDFAKPIVSQVINTIKPIVSNVKNIASSIDFGAVFSQSIDGLKNIFDVAKQIVSGYINNYAKPMFDVLMSIVIPIVGDAVSFLTKIGAQIKSFWNENGAQIMQAVNNVLGFIVKVVKVLAPVILFILNSVWNNVKGVIEGALKMIMGLVKVFASIFTGDWAGVWNGVKQILGGAVQFLWNLWNLLLLGKLVGSIKTIAKTFWGFLKGIGQTISTNVQYYYHMFVSGFYKISGSIIKSIFNAIGSIIGIIRNGVNVFIQTFNMARTFGVNIFMSIVSAVRNVFSLAFSAIRNAFANLVSTVGGFFSSIGGFLQTLWANISSIFMQIQYAMINPFNTVRSVVSSVVSFISGLVRSMFDGVVSTGRGAINGLIMAANAVIGGLNGLSVDIPDWVPKYGGRTFGLSIPKIPMLAQGGITTGPTLAMIGEGAEQEVVLPLSKLKNLLNGKGTNGNSGGNSEPTILFNPQIIVQGNADEGVIQKALNVSFNEFKKLMAKYEAEKKRLRLN